MPSDKNRITFIGKTNFRNIRIPFGIRKADRRYHTYIIGQTGTGKTTLLANMIAQDVAHGEGVAVLDPHGDFVERLVAGIPEARRNDLIYFNVPDPSCPFGFNPFAGVPPDRSALAASEIIETFKKIWEKTWGTRMEHIFRNVLLTLFAQPHATFADVRSLLSDSRFQAEALTRVTNPEVRDFWKKEFAGYTPRFKVEAINPILNKVGQFLANPHLYRVLVDAKRTIDARKVMDEGKILLVNLAKGKLGADNTSLLGSLLVSRIGLAALSRADQPESSRRDFYLYLDEFQNFTTVSTADMLSELRKYGLPMILANQFLDQLEDEVRDAVLGNVGTIISFRVGLKDAQLLERVYYPRFSASDLTGLPNYGIYVRMMIDGTVAKPFSADTTPEPFVKKAAFFLRVLIRSSLRLRNRLIHWARALKQR